MSKIIFRKKTCDVCGQTRTTVMATFGVDSNVAHVCQKCVEEAFVENLDNERETKPEGK